MNRSDFASILASILEEVPSHEATKTDGFPSDDLHFAYIVEPNFTSYSEANSTQASRIFSLDTDIFKLTEALATEMKKSSLHRPNRGKHAYSSSSKNSNTQDRTIWHEHKDWTSKENLAFTRLQNCIWKLETSKVEAGRETSTAAPFSTGFTQLELKKVYRKLVLFSHPDRETGDLSLFIQVKADYQTLMAFLEKIA